VQALVCCLMCAALAWPVQGQAQEHERAPSQAPLAEPPDYRSAIESAVDEYELGNFAEARSQFQRAHELYPNARSWRGMGMTEFELRNYPDAIDHLERALACEIKPLSESLRRETEWLLERARGYVARVTLRLEPRDASVTLDGVPLEPAQRDVLLLAVGDHTLEFRALNCQTEKRNIKVTGGEQRTLQVSLRDEATLREGRRWYKNPWLWTAAGVVVAGAATGIAIATARPDSELARPQGGTTGISLAGPP